MKTPSLWEATRTFFPLFLHELQKEGVRTVAVVGASDGKFVIPLAKAGFHVLAIERNPLAVNGGEVDIPGIGRARMPGLKARLQAEDVEAAVSILEVDFLANPMDLGQVDAVWTSCSWHYSLNHRIPVAMFIQRMMNMLQPGGIFGAEYMMPVEVKHFKVEHYMRPGELASYFDRDGVVWDLMTQPFVEAPHVEQLQPHVHQMGFVLAHL